VLQQQAPPMAAAGCRLDSEEGSRRGMRQAAGCETAGRQLGPAGGRLDPHANNVVEWEYGPQVGGWLEIQQGKGGYGGPRE